MRIDILTIFPGMFEAVLGESILKRAQDSGRLKICLHNLRDFSGDKHKKVDDRPFGGGPGMVLKPEPIFEAVKYIRSRVKGQRSRIILLSPQGRTLNQNLAKKLSTIKHMILICGHYEGIDNRVIEKLVTDEVSIGDYILTGGELAAMVIIDAIVRFIPEVLGDKESVKQESFVNNLLEYPQYTRPADFQGMKVPRVLLSGNHKKIEEWRRKESAKKTRERRPDLLNDKLIKNINHRHPRGKFRHTEQKKRSSLCSVVRFGRRRK